MYARERQRQILEALTRTGRVTVTDLSTQFEVDHRDHAPRPRPARRPRPAGARARRRRAAAHRPRSSPISSPAASRTSTPSDASPIAAAGLLPTDPQVRSPARCRQLPPLSCSPTSSGRRGPVITNAPGYRPGRTGPHRSCRCTCCPGRVRPTTEAAVGSSDRRCAAGPASRDRLPRLQRTGRCEGFTTPDPDEAAVKSAMVSSAAKRVILADSSKIGARHLVTFAALPEMRHPA